VNQLCPCQAACVSVEVAEWLMAPVLKTSNSPFINRLQRQSFGQNPNVCGTFGHSLSEKLEGLLEEFGVNC